jgi:hypothetical protein
MKFTAILATLAVAYAQNGADACQDAHTTEASCLKDTSTGGGCAWCKCSALPSAW